MVKVKAKVEKRKEEEDMKWEEERGREETEREFRQVERRGEERNMMNVVDASNCYGNGNGNGALKIITIGFAKGIIIIINII